MAEKGVIAEALHKTVWPMIAAGQLRPAIHATFPLEQARQAHEMMESFSHLGKILLVTGK